MAIDAVPTYDDGHEYGLIPESMRHWVLSDTGYVVEACGACGVAAYTALTTHRLPNGGRIYLCLDCTIEASLCL